MSLARRTLRFSKRHVCSARTQSSTSLIFLFPSFRLPRVRILWEFWQVPISSQKGRQRVSSQILGFDFDGFNSAVALVDARTLLHVEVLWIRYMGSVASALIARTL